MTFSAHGIMLTVLFMLLCYLCITEEYLSTAMFTVGDALKKVQGICSKLKP